MAVNSWHGIGNLGKDPELRYTPSGKAVATFSIAVTEKYNGEERTEWINIVVWEGLAEICGKYLEKGKRVYIEGRMQTRSYDDRDGNRRSITEIVAHKMDMLSPPSSGNQGQRPPASNNQVGPRESQYQQQQGGGFEEPVFNDDSDIPF